MRGSLRLRRSSVVVVVVVVVCVCACVWADLGRRPTLLLGRLGHGVGDPDAALGVREVLVDADQMRRLVPLHRLLLEDLELPRRQRPQLYHGIVGVIWGPMK